MICPSCGESVMKSMVIRRNIRGFKNVDIAYDAFCPFCHAPMGKVFWGEWIVDGEAVKPSVGYRAQWREDNEPVRRCCPHCGGPLPEDVSQLPQYQERRRGDRRFGDRRRVALDVGTMDRRRADRRQARERRLTGRD